MITGDISSQNLQVTNSTTYSVPRHYNLLFMALRLRRGSSKQGSIRDPPEGDYEGYSKALSGSRREEPEYLAQADDSLGVTQTFVSSNTWGGIPIGDAPSPRHYVIDFSLWIGDKCLTLAAGTIIAQNNT